ncbi:MAG TPA: trypsin-like peptidase domain-containing protein [Planctomycetota bacterium]|nr:trypsin-like peptidase domain-containing protein [Planctomycetota bacterium]HRU52652.1 trypsin-like peptidase domain-containing protein [Planctomycetota bacterium]
MKNFHFLLIIILEILWSCIVYAQNSRQTSIVKVVQKTESAIVNIVAEKNSELEKSSIANLFQKKQQNIKQHSSGAGVIIDPRGLIVTNAHVMHETSNIHVIFLDNRYIEAKVIAVNDLHDLAVLQIPFIKKYPCIKMGISSDLMRGETVIAIGNPYNLNHTVSVGIISGLQRSVLLKERGEFNDYIQIDASIHPGNSGGPLLNIHGELIGINVAVHSELKDIGFSIPVDRIRSTLGKMLDHTKIRNTSIGFTLQEKQTNSLQWIVSIENIVPYSLAESAGLKKGDVLEKVDNETIYSIFDFQRLMFFKNNQDVVTLHFKNKYPDIQLKVVSKTNKIQETEILWNDLGFSLQKTWKGVTIQSVKKNSSAFRIGIQSGDIVESFHGKKVSDIQEIQNIVIQHSGSTFTIVIVRNGKKFKGILEKD